MQYQIRDIMSDRRGSIAIVFALALLPLIAVAGAAIDYSRASSARVSAQKAIDSAALAAAALRNATMDARATVAEAVVNESLSDFSLKGISFTTVVSEDDSGGIFVGIEVEVPTTLIQVLGLETMKISATATAMPPSGAEIALVLDTTGSMRNDMDALRNTASNFVRTVFASASPDSLRMSVVPYVAAVNPGRDFLLASGAVDVEGDNRWHANNMRRRHIANLANCISNPFATPNPPRQPNPNPPPPSPPPPPPAPPPRERETSVPGLWQLPSLAQVAQELFGIADAQAQARRTPNTNTPLGYWQYQILPPYSATGNPITVNIPIGFGAGPLAVGTACRVYNPTYINHLDLFDRAGTRWKGCVEARPIGLDVREDPPISPDSRFVPYFWPDEPGQRNQNTYSNSYQNEVPSMPGFSAGNQNWLSILKYDRTKPSRIIDHLPTTYGPNAACPDEVLPLTSNQGAILNRISTLRHYFGGGTISSEGLMWGWRTISPLRPFAMGQPYGEVRKFIVLMTDGENMISANAHSSTSDYTAYGFLWQNRLGSGGNENSAGFQNAAVALDNRMTQACNGAKARGITVLTILFRETSPRAINNVRDCASRPDLFYRAADQAALDAAFQSIAGQISNLRLVR
jgi:Flp pilus assembly protein TadG